MKNLKKAQKHFNKARQLLKKVKSPFEGMSENAVIKKLRKTREELWEEKLAPHS